MHFSIRPNTFVEKMVDSSGCRGKRVVSCFAALIIQLLCLGRHLHDSDEVAVFAPASFTNIYWIELNEAWTQSQAISC